MSNLATLSTFGYTPSTRFFDEFDAIFDTFLGDRRSGGRAIVQTPRVNIEETTTGYTIHMAAPGLSRDDFKIHADSGYLTISVEGSADTKEKTSYVTREYSYSSFSRSWKLPSSVNTDGISARYDAGVLSVTVPTSSKKSSKVEIKVD